MRREIFYEDVLQVHRLNNFRRQEPEKLLMMAVLIDAINCLNLAGQIYPNECHKWQRKQRLQKGIDAKEWVMNNNSTQLFSFVNICDSLDIDPNYLRRGIFQHPFSRMARDRNAVKHSVSEN